jgi:SOS1/NGEF-like PH domain
VKVSKGKFQSRHFWLFNDCIVYGKAQSKNKYLFKDKIPLDFIVCSDLENTESRLCVVWITREGV